MRASDRYDGVAILLHWSVAALVAAQFVWGWWMLTIPEDPPGLQAGAFNLHKSVGLSILGLMLLRVAWRVTHRPPPLPPMPAWQSRLARTDHALLYALLLLLPATGYLGSAFSGYPVSYFGIVLPSWAAENGAAKELLSVAHLALTWLLAASVGLHVAGVLKHTWVDHDRLLRRMLPARRRAGRGAGTAGRGG
jgi:cytochrome b561